MNNLLVVGVGASAGGVQALRKFFTNVMPDDGVVYVAILHLSPEHESRLADLLRIDTRLLVIPVTERVSVEGNHIYVISPNQSLSMEDGTLAVSPMVRDEERRAPVDIFFRTLADARGAHSACVVLSGTGADGSMGLKRIKERGGLCLVQDPHEAEHGEMPRNAIATGLVDQVLPIADIPGRIVSYRRSLANPRTAAADETPAASDERALREVLGHVRARTGHDFSNYKRATLLRRVDRRVAIHDLHDLSAYATYVREHPEEAHSLIKDLLISVTNFFRDREAFEVLERQFIPRLFEKKREEDHVRVWVAGCATGEEAYSVAMLLIEYASHLNSLRVQLFATDIDDEAIAVARNGVYTMADTADVSPERLRRFFNRDGELYRVRKELREMVLFARHNVIKDPPFAHLDLVTCRNLLIYLNRPAQERVLELFNHAISPGRFLFLGSSESIEGSNDLFVVADKAANIFQSRERPIRPLFPLPDPPSMLPVHPTVDVRPRVRERLSYADLHQRLLEEYAPPSVIVNEDYDILHLSARAGRFMQLSGGEPSSNVLKLVRPELRIDLRAALYQARQERTSIDARNLAVTIDGEVVALSLSVRPVLREADTARGYFLVLFDERPASGAVPEPANFTTGEAARQLEDEVQRLRMQLRATVEQHEIQTEELRASNEELHSMNEELRSTAEELETSKEELQSVNEELTTVNQELKITLEEQAQANNDIQNLIDTTEIAVLFLDRSLKIKLYTPRAGEVFNLIKTDRGRLLSDISSRLIHAHLHDDIDRVLARLDRLEREVQTVDGRWLLMRIVPYRTSDDRIDGVVLTFVDITEHKRAEIRVRESERRFRAILNQTAAGICSADLTGRLLFANERLGTLLGWPSADLTGKTIHMVADIGDGDETARFFERLGRDGTSFEVERRVVRGDGSVLWVGVSVSAVRNDEGAVESAVAVILDVSRRKQIEEDLRHNQEQLQMVLDAITEHAIITMDARGIIEGWNSAAEGMFGYSASEIIGQSAEIIFTHEDRAGGVHLDEMRRAQNDGRASDERWHMRKDGSRFYVSGVLSPIRGQAAAVGFVKVARDLTERKQQEEALRRAYDQLEVRITERTQQLAASKEALEGELAERREAEGRVRNLLTRLISVQEDERRRIARDLHDDLGQKMTALHLKLEAMRRAAANSPLHSQVQEAQAFVQKLDRDLDFFTWELRPAALYDLGLVPALRDYVSQWSKNFNIPADFDAIAIARERFRPELEINMYRIAQEALNNVYKHAKAKQIAVVVQRRDADVVVSIEDDGVGFDAEALDAHGRGIGLIGMRERAALMNGRVQIEHAASGGTTIIVSAPAAPGADAAATGEA